MSPVSVWSTVGTLHAVAISQMASEFEPVGSMVNHRKFHRQDQSLQIGQVSTPEVLAFIHWYFLEVSGGRKM